MWYSLAVVLSLAVEGVTVIQGDKMSLNMTPAYSHGYLVTHEQAALVLYGPSGALAFKIPRPENTALYNAAVDTDGTVVVTVGMGGRRGKLAFFRLDGSLASEIQTSPYKPAQAAFAPDHSVWVLGGDRDSPSTYLIRHYAKSGELLGEFLPQSTLPPESSAGLPFSGITKLWIAGERIGVRLDGAGALKQTLWLEMDLNGKETGRWTLPHDVEPLAMTESGKVYAQKYMLETYLLDRTTGQWMPVPAASTDRLLGADGETLVFSVRGQNAIRRSDRP